MSIADNIRQVQEKIRQDPNEGVRLKALAVKAIYSGMPNGQASADWIAYMNEFKKTPEELARLTTRATDCNPYQEPARAYLIGNGICLPITEGNLLGGIEGYLDVTLQGPATRTTKPPKGTRHSRTTKRAGGSGRKRARSK